MAAALGKLNKQIETFTAWKLAVCHELDCYQELLREQGQVEEEIHDQLDQLRKTLIEDRLLLAFVGEFSRGKSELINAILGRHYGQRLLPSQIGRTTMCPAELFYDASATGAYIKLLPIETRLNKSSLAELKHNPESWEYIAINLDDPLSLKKNFKQIAAIREVSRSDAEKLGFDLSMLEISPDNKECVFIPKWRHALINIDHPLLRQGLAIIDTPGLNALGMEPELTFSLLPDAQALLFVLSVDTGVTASDYQIWQNHLQQLIERRKNTCYVVLNKIDLLWDEDEDDEDIQDAIDRVLKTTAAQLNLSLTNIFPLSAKQAFKARMSHDDNLLERSQIEELENLLAKNLVTERFFALKQGVLDTLTQKVIKTRQTLIAQKLKLEAEERVHISGKHDNQQLIEQLRGIIQQEEKGYQHRQLYLHQSRKLVERQLPRLMECTQSQNIHKHWLLALAKAEESHPTFPLQNALERFFSSLKKDFQNFSQEVKVSGLLIQNLFEKYQEETQEEKIPLIEFSTAVYGKELAGLEKQAHDFANRLQNLPPTQRQAYDKFVETLAREAGYIYECAHSDVGGWCKQAISPIMERVLAFKNQLVNHKQRLDQLQQVTESIFEKTGEIKEQRKPMQTQLQTLEAMHNHLLALQGKGLAEKTAAV